MADVKKIIKDLGGSFGSDNEAQMKGVQLLKGLATSDDPLSNKFMQALDKATTKISKDLTGGKEESVMVTLEKDLKVNSNVILEKGDTFEIIKESFDNEQVEWYSYAAAALINGDYSGLTDEDEEEVNNFLDFIQRKFGRDASIVDISDEHYFGYPVKVPGNSNLAGDISKYTVLY